MRKKREKRNRKYWELVVNTKSKLLPMPLSRSDWRDHWLYELFARLNGRVSILRDIHCTITGSPIAVLPVLSLAITVVAAVTIIMMTIRDCPQYGVV